MLGNTFPDGWPNFLIEPKGELGTLCLAHDLKDYHAVTYYIWKLPYKRISNPNHIGGVILEGRGTCSSKHAFLAALAEEHGQTELVLQIVLFRMHGKNTPSIVELLDQYKVESFPEAHTRLIYRRDVFDFTFPTLSIAIDPQDILELHTANPLNLRTLKSTLHNEIIIQWSQKLGINPEVLVKLREACIEHFSGV